MAYMEKLCSLFEGLDENDQKSVFEFARSLARSEKSLKNEEVINILGKNFFVVPD
jgi:hypothetical protein